MPDYRQLAADKEREWDPLFKRMDTDRDLVNLVKYILKDTENPESAIPHAVGIALNDILVFDTNVEASLGKAAEQVVVQSEDKSVDTAKVERIVKASFKAADQLLTTQGRWELTPFTNQQTCRRGRCATGVRFEVDEDGELTPGLIPMDTRFLTYGMDKNGLAWTSYKTQRSRDMVLVDYPDAKVQHKSTDIEVQDIWSRDHNELWIDGKEMFTQPHFYKHVPVVIRVVPMGSMLMDVDSIKYWGESLFFMIRDLVPELNRLVSIIQSLNIKELDHALQLKVPNEELPLAETPLHDEVTSPRAVNALPTEGGYSLMPLGELRRQAWLVHSMIDIRVQRGGINSFDTGTFNQDMSAIALIQVAEGRDQVHAPRLGTGGLQKQGIAEMLIDQIIGSGVSEIRLGRQTYKVSDLEGEYDIFYKYTMKSPGKDAARFAMAQGAGEGLVSKKTKRTTILELEDPDGEERQLKIEGAEDLFPSIKKARTIIALAEDADAGSKQSEIDLELALEELGVTLDQIMAGDIEQGIPQEAQQPQDLPLLPGLGARTGRPSRELIDGDGENA